MPVDLRPHVARGLYDSLGYEVTATNMAKPL